MFQSRRKGGGGLPHSPRRTARLQEPQGLTLAHYAAAKKLPVSFLKSLGLTDIYFDGRPAVRIPYLGVEGFDAAVQFRLSMDGEDRFRWKTGSKPCLYGLWKLEEARAAGYICLVEGSSDSHTLWQHGIPALGLPGATTWREEWSNHLRGIETIYVMIEPDKGGEAVKRWLSSSEIRHRARLVTLVGAKDPSAMYLSDPEGFKGKWVAALASSVPWHKVERAEEIARAKALWAQCESLAVQPNILDLFEAALSRIFVVGERRTARLMYLALTSRFLDRPVSIATKGPSGCGKSYLAEKVLIFFPQSAYHVLTAMSEKALAYSSEPLKHRFVVILEATGLQGEWVSYFVRSLLSEDRICYETVEKTKDGLRPRRIEREGPTGLITTTTAVSLHPENETRFFSVEVDDSPDQTRKVLKAAAERINQDDTAIGDEEIGRFLAFQEWLAAANHRVVIPYASALAEQIPPVAVRLRRDFKAILSLIQAHAIVHQASRKQDDRGRIIATFEDYRAVRDIVSDIVSDGVQLTTSQATRQTVEAVREANERGSRCEEDGASVKEVADSLKLDVSTASRRVKVCLKNGYLRNLESRRGRPYKLVVGDSLPGEMLLLPDAESLARCCSVAASPEDGAPPPPSREPPGPDGVSPEIEEEL
ncbi:MAG TPA: hypothetical protein VG204_02725 [Terriglobia bacterium]|nr:hypothetical protein [Terriglobia bacterium]